MSDSLLNKLAADLNVPAGGEVVGEIVFEPLDVEERIDPPDILVDDCLYDGGYVHLVSGHPGAGKTSWTMQLAWIAMAQGRHVAWLDYEGGKRPTARRLQAVGVSPALVRERFHYASWPAHSERHMTAVAERWPGALVIVDSMSKALAFAGLNENKNEEVTKWNSWVVRASKTTNIPIVIIDHVKKDAKDAEYSRGAGAKLADVDVHWSVRTEQKFSRTRAGSIAVSQKKDREGCLPFETWWRMGDGNGNLTIESLDSPPDANNNDSPNV